MRPKLAIIYYNFLDKSGRNPAIGGIETYLRQLLPVARREGFTPRVFQVSNIPFEHDDPEAPVTGIACSDEGVKSQRRRLYRAGMKWLDGEGVLLFGADHCSVKTSSRAAVSIQHGVSWDLPSYFRTRNPLLKNGFGARVKKLQAILEAARFFENVRTRVCVDYNFLNWYRTLLGGRPKGIIRVIPNAVAFPSRARIDEKFRRVGGAAPRILFARRFEAYRGTRVFCEALLRLNARGHPFTVTIAGEGPDAGYLREKLQGLAGVTFAAFESADAVATCLGHDIAVVPSIGSEGTSFSVLEAMAGACAIVATNVGGMTNMILSGYNGMLVNPDVPSLTYAIERFLLDPQLRRRHGEAAWESGRHAFGLAAWERAWAETLRSVAELE